MVGFEQQLQQKSWIPLLSCASVILSNTLTEVSLQLHVFKHQLLVSAQNEALPAL